MLPSMPTVFRYKGIRFFFYTKEGKPLEPMHIHAEHGGKTAKIWLQPAICIASSYGFSRKDQAELVRVTAEHRAEIERKWNECFR